MVKKELPLAAASVRLRRPSGRLRKDRGTSIAEGTAAASGQAAPGPTPRTAAYEAVGSIPPRLLGLRAAAAYLGVSPWTIRDLEADGTLRRVNVPLGIGRELRKLLFDREDLDQLVDSWKI
jgi:hypothetical protein